MITSGESSSQTVVPMRADTVLEQLQLAVVVLDRFSTIVYFNAFAERLFGFDAAKVIGCPVMDLGIADEDRHHAVELAREVLRGGRWYGTICNVRGDGSRMFTRIEAIPRRDSRHRVNGMVIFAREALTERQGQYEDRLGLFNQLGRILSESLGFDVTLRKVADVLVPQLAEHCFIDLYDADGVLRRQMLHHADHCRPPAGVWAGAGEEVRYPPGHFCEGVIEREQTVLVEDLRRRRADRIGLRGHDLCEEAGLRSVVAAPLKARGMLLGVMTLARSEYGERTGPCFDGDDHSLVGAIASRIAVAVDNAMLFEEERETALGFQKGLLPRDLPLFDGLDTAHVYQPAEPLIEGGVQTQAGGDWYDLIPLSAGRVGIVIGDVEGHGARAAAIMGQLRAAVRAFAQFDLPPAQLLTRLEEWVRTFETTSSRHEDDGPVIPKVSCLYLIYDAWSRQLWYANAGHDPPLLVDGGSAEATDTSCASDASGTARVGQLEVERGQYLGTDPAAEPPQLPLEQTCTLPPGTALLLYTDGLTKWQPEDFGGDAVLALKDRIADVADMSVDRLAEEAVAVVPDGIDDDVAVLALRSHTRDLDVEECVLSADPAMVSGARRMAAGAFDRWGVPEEQSDVACLLISEVVTNAVRHATITPSPRSVEDSFLEFAESMFADGIDADDAGGADLWESIPAPAGGCQGAEGRVGGDDQELVLRLRRGAYAVWVEVFDRDLRLPRIRVADENDEGGRGLYLVERLSNRWGSRATRDGKWVWFELSM